MVGILVGLDSRGVGIAGSGSGLVTGSGGLVGDVLRLTCHLLDIVGIGTGGLGGCRRVGSRTFRGGGGSLHIAYALVGQPQHTVILVDKIGVGTQTRFLEIHRRLVYVLEAVGQTVVVALGSVNLTLGIVALLLGVVALLGSVTSLGVGKLRLLVSQRSGIVGKTRLLGGQFCGTRRTLGSGIGSGGSTLSRAGSGTRLAHYVAQASGYAVDHPRPIQRVVLIIGAALGHGHTPLGAYSPALGGKGSRVGTAAARAHQPLRCVAQLSQNRLQQRPRDGPHAVFCDDGLHPRFPVIE